jgi:hypothetical protein
MGHREWGDISRVGTATKSKLARRVSQAVPTFDRLVSEERFSLFDYLENRFSCLVVGDRPPMSDYLENGEWGRNLPSSQIPQIVSLQIEKISKSV